MADELNLTRISLIGFGEAGDILGSDLAALHGPQVASYDILFDKPARKAAILAKADRGQVRAAAILPRPAADSPSHK